LWQEEFIEQILQAMIPFSCLNAHSLSELAGGLKAIQYEQDGIIVLGIWCFLLSHFLALFRLRGFNHMQHVTCKISETVALVILLGDRQDSSP
jgi:hypothetical protein